MQIDALEFVPAACICGCSDVCICYANVAGSIFSISHVWGFWSKLVCEHRNRQSESNLVMIVLAWKHWMSILFFLLVLHQLNFFFYIGLFNKELTTNDGFWKIFPELFLKCPVTAGWLMHRMFCLDSKILTSGIASRKFKCMQPLLAEPVSCVLFALRALQERKFTELPVDCKRCMVAMIKAIKRNQGNRLVKILAHLKGRSKPKFCPVKYIQQYSLYVI